MPRSIEELLADLLDAIERELPLAVELRRRLHAEPELAHAEQRTAAAIAEQLPVPATTAAGTGRIARVGPQGERTPLTRIATLTSELPSRTVICAEPSPAG